MPLSHERVSARISERAMSQTPLDDELQELKTIAFHLRTELHELTDRIDRLELRRRIISKLEADRPPPHLTEATPAPAPVEIPPQMPPPVTSGHVEPPAIIPEKAATISSFVRRINREPPEITPEPATIKPQSAGIEERIGKIWLNRIGAIILLLGVAFFVKYSFDQGWISPTLRVCMGGVAGLALIAVGEYALRMDKRPFAAGLLGAGIVVLYFAAFAAHYFYQLLSINTTFVLLCGVTVLSSVIAVHGRMIAIAIMGLVGGFWTPLALSTGMNQQVALMVYLLVLDCGFLAVGSIRRWDAMRLLCWLGSAVLFAGWGYRFYSSDALHSTLGFLTAFYLVFHAEAIISLRFRRATSVSILPALIHASNVAYFAMVYFLAVDTHLDPWLGLFCVVTAAVQIFVGWRLIGAGPLSDRCRESLFIDGAAMLALAAPIQFDRSAVPVAWGAQAAVTLLFCRWNPRPWLRFKAVGILTAALAHLILYDFSEPQLVKTIASVGHWQLNWITILFVGLGLFAYLGAACLAFRRQLDTLDTNLACGLVLAGSAVMLGIWAYEYERYLAAWWWLGLAALWFLLSRPFPIAALVFGLLALVSCGKFLAWDTVASVQQGAWAEISGIIVNRAVLTGGLVTLAIILAIWRFKLYMSRQPQDSSVWQFLSTDEFIPVLIVLACLTVTWTGTFEFARIFTFEAWGKGFKQSQEMGSVLITAFWAIHAVILWVLFGRRSTPVACYSLFVCCIATVKLAVPDTFHLVVTNRWGYLEGLCKNRVFIVGLATIASWFACGAMTKRWPLGRQMPLLSHKNIHRLWVWGAILTIWLPTFEIMRTFHFEPIRNHFANPSLAMHVALSILWSLFAVIVLGIGFARLIAPLRYLAIVLFGMTVIKVLVVDLANLETLYRIISFIVLGALLLAASFLYQQLSARILVKDRA
jgi:uncharacterized membrane protein